MPLVCRTIDPTAYNGSPDRRHDLADSAQRDRPAAVPRPPLARRLCDDRRGCAAAGLADLAKRGVVGIGLCSGRRIRPALAFGICVAMGESCYKSLKGRGI